MIRFILNLGFFCLSQFFTFECWAQDLNKREISSVSKPSFDDIKRNIFIAIPLPKRRKLNETLLRNNYILNYKHTDTEKYYGINFTVDL